MRRVKIKTAKKQLGDKSIVDMFNQMLGTDDADPEIVTPKYNSIKHDLNTVKMLLTQMTTNIILKVFPEEKIGCDDIKTYVNSLNDIKFIDTTPKLKYESKDTKNNKDSKNGKNNVEELKDEDNVSKAYLNLKTDNRIKLLILTCKNLIYYSERLNSKPIDPTFINRIPGFDFMPFAFSRLNVKRMWSSESITPRIKQYVLMVLKIILNTSKNIYKTITSPDVDVKKFSAVIIKSIAKVKKQIPRCEKAFAKIEQSIGLLEGNFNEYYKDFISSQNPSTIMESFVIDVSQSGDVDAQTTRQFRKIINYYRKATQGKIKDPKINKIFNMLNTNFDEIERQNNINEKNNEKKIINKYFNY